MGRVVDGEGGGVGARGALLDPKGQEIDFGSGEPLPFIDGWHAVVLVVGGDELEQVASEGIAGNDAGDAGPTSRHEDTEVVDAEIGFLFIGAVAFQAVVLEDGTNVLMEIDGVGFAGANREAKGEAEQG